MKFKSHTIKNIVFRKIPHSLKFGCGQNPALRAKRFPRSEIPC